MDKDDNPAQAVTQAIAALEGFAGKGAFACRSKLPADSLALSIDGFGNLRLPISIQGGGEQGVPLRLASLCVTPPDLTRPR